MEHDPESLYARGLFENPAPTSTQLPHTCRPFLLPSGGLVNLGSNDILTLDNDAVFQPPCRTVEVPQPTDPLDADFHVSVLGKERPFSSSLDPQIYAIAAVTIVSYMLVIILFITPRTFYVGGAGGGVSILGRRGTIGGTYGSNPVIGIGSRPWLQKLAALTLAASLTIVTADTFKWAERQYNDGYQDAGELSEKVNEGLEIRIVRLISESFLWLAQAQTLIRLFQRHKEKVVIKWTAFVLITLEIIFSILNHFVHEGNPHQPKAFANSIPALNYLFALALNICYAAFVIIYSLRKRRFAFFHPQMHSMPLTALLSLTAVLIPAIFFILDLSKPGVSGWGGYVRWVGACAASVVVWEWVERIEALEREEKKDGILGREVFDGDEMLDANPPQRDWPGAPPGRDNRQGPGGGFNTSTGLNKVTSIARRFRKPKAPEPMPLKDLGSNSCHSSGQSETITGTEHAKVPSPTHNATPPPNASSPPSRADTNSAASTVYRIRYHPVTEPTPPIPEDPQAEDETEAQQLPARERSEAEASEKMTKAKIPSVMGRFSNLNLPFRRQRQSPPAEVAAALAGQQLQTQTPGPAPDHSQPSSILERLHLRKAQASMQTPGHVIVVPAPRPRCSTSSDGRQPSNSVSTEHDINDSDDNDIDGDDRPPAVVRNALRLSNPASPVNETGTSFPINNTHIHAPDHHAHMTDEDIQREEPYPSTQVTYQPSAPMTNHDR